MIEKYRRKVQSLEKYGDLKNVRIHKKKIEGALKECSLVRWRSLLERISLVDTKSSVDSMPPNRLSIVCFST